VIGTLQGGIFLSFPYLQTLSLTNDDFFHWIDSKVTLTMNASLDWYVCKEQQMKPFQVALDILPLDLALIFVLIPRKTKMQSRYDLVRCHHPRSVPCHLQFDRLPTMPPWARKVPPCAVNAKKSNLTLAIASQGNLSADNALRPFSASN
jgi:hypothetical protein